MPLLRIILVAILASTVLGSTVYGVSIAIRPASDSSNNRPPDFTITSSQPSTTTTESYATARISIATVNGYHGQVSLDANVPFGIHCQGTTGSLSFAMSVPGSWALSCSSIFEGSFTVNVTATGGQISKTTSVIFNFIAASNTLSITSSCDQSVIITVKKTTSCNVTVIDNHTRGSEPIGNVSFDNSPELLVEPNICSLIHGTCIIQLTPMAPGVFTLTAFYTGDSKHSSLRANFLLHAALTPTKTTIDCNPPTIPVHTTGTNCLVIVSDMSNSTNYLSGNVNLTITSNLGHNTTSNCILSNGTCRTGLQFNNTGTFNLTAQYLGNESYQPSNGKFTVTVTGSNTVVFLKCNPTDIIWNITYGLCTATVKDLSPNPTTPTGNVNATCTSQCYGVPATNCQLISNSTDNAYCSFNLTSGDSSISIMNVSGKYSGDNNHMASQSLPVIFNINPGPDIVTVSGSVRANCPTCTVSQLDFVDVNSGTVYIATVVDGTYTVQLTNRISYDVILHWIDMKGNSGTCDGGRLILRSADNATMKRFVC